jgi:NAD-specific glutamate dehydrogenase
LEKLTSHYGAPDALAEALAKLPVRLAACDAIRIAQLKGRKIEEIVQIYFKISQYFQYARLLRDARQLPTDTRWSAEARISLIDDLYTSLSDMTLYLCSGNKNSKLKNALEEWIKANSHTIEQINKMTADLDRQKQPDFYILTLIAQRLRSLAHT